MERWYSRLTESVVHLAFPHICFGCGSDLIHRDNLLCADCIDDLPSTFFHLHEDNPVAKMFWGRMPVAHATAQFYFTKESLMQRLMHELKYRGNKELGKYFGKMMGARLETAVRFQEADIIIPLPLHPSKQRKRGYNQSLLLAEGIAEQFAKPVLTGAIIRKDDTDSQTRKNRLQRWENMEGHFRLADYGKIANKHVLLIDDVVTTGATLEACGRELLKVEGVTLSIATLCITS
jgi:ComF family protein